jgi:hypothetical protein
MGSTDSDGVVGRIKSKVGELMNGDDDGDADPDVEYEPTPDQRILYDGMVVLSESQISDEEADDEGGRASGSAE